MTTNQMTKPSKKIHITSTTILFVIAICVFATTLRTPITGVGPIISYIREGLQISNVLAGFLTTLPLLSFAMISPFAPRVAKRVGMELTLFLSLIIIAIGIVIRSLGTTPTLILGTILIGIAISFGNVLMQSFFKLKFPYHIGILTGLYTVSMNISAGLSLGISQPIAEKTSFGWQGALGFSILLTIIAILVWIPLLRGEKINLSSLNNNHVYKEDKKMWKSPLAWAIAISMGMQSLLFYCSTAWLPEILISQGLSAENAGWMTSIMQYAQIPMTFLVPIIAEKFSSQRPIVFVFTFFYLVSFIGIYNEWTDYVIIWMVCLGLAGGASFGAILMFFTLRTKTAYEAAQISGFAQSVGYLLASAGPVLFGYLHDTSGSWSQSNLLFIIVTIILFTTAFISAKNRYV